MQQILCVTTITRPDHHQWTPFSTEKPLSITSASNPFWLTLDTSNQAHRTQQKKATPCYFETSLLPQINRLILNAHCLELRPGHKTRNDGMIWLQRHSSIPDAPLRQAWQRHTPQLHNGNPKWRGMSHSTAHRSNGILHTLLISYSWNTS